MQSSQLLSQLTQQTETLIAEAEKLKKNDLHTLNWKKDVASWSMLECLEHLNRYGEFYLGQIEKKIAHSGTQVEPIFKSGFLGSYFAKSMLPKEKLKKMKTFKDKNPLNANLEKTVLDTFIAQQQKLKHLIKKSEKVSLNKVRIPTTLSKMIKINLGDTFQFVINHELRHFKQIERVASLLKG